MTKPLTRRLACASLAIPFLPLPRAVKAQTAPHPLRVIVPNVPGSPPDVMMRAIADKLQTSLKRTVVIENKPGAGGIIAVQAQLSARDGNTILFMLTGVAAITPLLFKSARYDVLTDLAPIAGIGETTVMMAAATNVPAKTLKEAIAYANASPGKVVLGHPGNGTLGHLVAEHLVQLSQAKFHVVPFTPATGPTALAGGDAQFYLDGTGTLLPFAKGGRAHVVTVFSPNTLPGLEGYSLAKDTVPGAEAMGYFGLMGPKDMPGDAIQTLVDSLKVTLADPDVIARLRDLATYPAFRTGPAYAEVVRKEKVLWASVAKQAGMQAQ